MRRRIKETDRQANRQTDRGNRGMKRRKKKDTKRKGL